MNKYRIPRQRLHTYWNSGDGDGAMSPVVERSHENSPLSSPKSPTTELDTDDNKYINGENSLDDSGLHLTKDTGDNKYKDGENSLDNSGLHLTKEYEDSSSSDYLQDSSIDSLNDSGLDMPERPDIGQLQTLIKQLKEENKDLKETVSQMKEQMQHQLRYTTQVQESCDDAVDLTVSLREEIAELENRLQKNEVSKQLQTESDQQLEDIKLQYEDITYLTKTIYELEQDVQSWRVRSSLLDIDNDGYKQEIMDLNERIYQLMKAGKEDKKRLDDLDESKVQPLFSDVMKALSPNASMEEVIPRSPSIKTTIDKNVMKELPSNSNMAETISKPSIKTTIDTNNSQVKLGGHKLGSSKSQPVALNSPAASAIAAALEDRHLQELAMIQRCPSMPIELGSGEPAQANSEILGETFDNKQNYGHDAIQTPSFAAVMKALSPNISLEELKKSITSPSIKTDIDNNNDKVKLGRQKLTSPKLQQIQRCPSMPIELGNGEPAQSNEPNSEKLVDKKQFYGHHSVLPLLSSNSKLAETKKHIPSSFIQADIVKDNSKAKVGGRQKVNSSKSQPITRHLPVPLDIAGVQEQAEIHRRLKKIKRGFSEIVKMLSRSYGTLCDKINSKNSHIKATSKDSSQHSVSKKSTIKSHSQYSVPDKNVFEVILHVSNSVQSNTNARPTKPQVPKATPLEFTYLPTPPPAPKNRPATLDPRKNRINKGLVLSKLNLPADCPLKMPTPPVVKDKARPKRLFCGNRIHHCTTV